MTLLLLAVLAGTGWAIWRDLNPAPATARVEPSTPMRGGTLVSSLRTEPRSFNRLAARDVPADLFAHLTLGRLVRVNRATQEVEPWLAERWSTSDDGRTFTLTLRDGVRWSDGQPFTAADVLFTFEALYDKSAKSVLATSLTVDGRPLAVSAPDPRTIVVTFPAPFGPGIRLLDNLVLLPRHTLEPALRDGTFAQAWSSATPAADIPAIGPFRFVRYEPGQRVVFERNPNFWRRNAAGEPLPYLDGIVLEIVPDQNAELVRLQSGAIDMLPQALRAEDIATLRPLVNERRLSLLELGVSTDPDSFFFNLRAAQWKGDPRGAWMPRDEFRQAISHAIDREAFAETVFLAAAVPIHGPVTPGNRTWFWPSVPRYEFSPEKARARLAAIGLENRDADEWLEDVNGVEARFNVLTFRGNTTLERSAAFVRDSLKSVGIAMDVVPLEAGALFERLTTGKFEAIFFNFSSTDLDPAMNKDFWLSSGSAHVWNIGQPTPSTPWEQEIDALMMKQAAATDFDERRRLFNEVQRIFAEHLPIIYFAAPRLYMGVSPRVGHLEPSPTRPHLLWSADTMTATGASSDSR